MCATVTGVHKGRLFVLSSRRRRIMGMLFRVCGSEAESRLAVSHGPPRGPPAGWASAVTARTPRTSYDSNPGLLFARASESSKKKKLPQGFRRRLVLNGVNSAVYVILNTPSLGV